ncbi:hypothetical protein PR048_013205 [Dryococelus australis]|uniref:Integrase zinc-binding domain-containing protein n=1 Tax=Dryococelus australis TaxID=614101 RepID=A0ABQ9HRN5_9NEOP|nr:hypothetical protein PR048_013205 [Dryococelus australis]
MFQGLIGQLNQEIAGDVKYAKVLEELKSGTFRKIILDLFAIQNGILFRRKEIREVQWVLLIPDNMSGELCVKAHEKCGHFGIAKKC